MKTKYRFFSDPGHGWAKVTRQELKDLGVADKISSCSYALGEHVYLEEDCDLSLFVAAKTARGETPVFVDHSSNSMSRIRSYPRYQPAK